MIELQVLVAANKIFAQFSLATIGCKYKRFTAMCVLDTNEGKYPHCEDRFLSSPVLQH